MSFRQVKVIFFLSASSVNGFLYTTPPEIIGKCKEIEKKKITLGDLVSDELLPHRKN